MDSWIVTLQVADRVAKLALSPDGALVAIGGKDSHSVLVYSIHNGQQIYEPLRTGHYICSVTFSPDGRMKYLKVSGSSCLIPKRPMVK